MVMKGRNIFLVRNVAPENYGGGEIYQLKLAKELKKYNFIPIIVTNSRELLKSAYRDGIKTLIPPYSIRQNWSGWRNIFLPKYFIFQKKLEKWYKKSIKEYNPLVINIQSRDDMIAGTIAARKVGVRVLWTDHADFRNWVLWNVNVKYKNLIGKRIIELSKDAERVVFVGNAVARETKKMIKPLVLHNTIVIENGVEDKKLIFEDVKEEDGSFIFLGRVTEEKGINEMIEAFTRVINKYPEARLNIYGSGEINEFSGKCNNCSNIEFHGQTDEPLKALAGNEIFVLPSYREGLSLSLLDAAMMGKKIIASDVDGNPEVVKNGKTGLLVPPKNVEKLAEAMIYMLKNKKEADKMAKNARKYYEENFNFDKIFVEKMLPLYNNEKEEVE